MFGVPNIVRHPYRKDPRRDPTLENYPHTFRDVYLGFRAKGLSPSTSALEMLYPEVYVQNPTQVGNNNFTKPGASALASALKARLF